MRVLTVTPSEQGWVALPPDDVTYQGWAEHVGTYVSPHPAVGDVLGLVEQCKTCTLTFAGRLIHNPHCLDCLGTGHLLTGFVRVVEVLPTSPFPLLHWRGPDERRLPPRRILVDALGACWLADNRDGTIRIDLPNAVPGGVAIRVEPCKCPTCDGDDIGSVTGEGGGLMVTPCPTCSDLPRPVTLHGDAALQEVEWW